jgi:hypothetical protein
MFYPYAIGSNAYMITCVPLILLFGGIFLLLLLEEAAKNLWLPWASLATGLICVAVWYINGAGLNNEIIQGVGIGSFLLAELLFIMRPKRASL